MDQEVRPLMPNSRLPAYLRGPRERGPPPLPLRGGPSKGLRGGPSDRPAGNAARGGSGKLAMPAG
jgi:hypothetical protein